MNRARLATVAKAVGYPLVVVFLGWQLWRVRHGLTDSLRTVGWGNATAAGLLAAVGGVPGFFGWRVLLAGLGTRLATYDAVRVFFLAGITRYLPGGVWPTVAHAALARPLGESPARLAGAFLASQGLGVVSGLVVGLLALPWLVAADPLWWLLLPVVAGAVLPLAAPRLLGAGLAAAQRLLRRGDPTTPPALPGPRALLGATVLMLLGWLVSGVHIAVLAIALGADPGEALTVGVGGFALSVVAGIFAVVLPTGLGVREVVLALTLATLLGGADLITLVALSRVLLTVGDVGSTAVVLALLSWTGRRRSRAAPTAPEHAAPVPTPPGAPVPTPPREPVSAAAREPVPASPDRLEGAPS